MYLERFGWGTWTAGEELFSALQRGFLPTAYEYLYRTKDVHGLRKTIRRVLDLPLEGKTRRRLLRLLRSADKLVFLDRGDEWVMVMLGGKVVGWTRR